MLPDAMALSYTTKPSLTILSSSHSGRPQGSTPPTQMSPNATIVVPAEPSENSLYTSQSVRPSATRTNQDTRIGLGPFCIGLLPNGLRPDTRFLAACRILH